MYLTYVVNMIIINLKTFMLQSKNNLYSVSIMEMCKHLLYFPDYTSLKYFQLCPC